MERDSVGGEYHLPAADTDRGGQESARRALLVRRVYLPFGALFSIVVWFLENMDFDNRGVATYLWCPNASQLISVMR